MDKQHKEELQQNDLQEFITHFGTFWSRHGTSILVVILVALGTAVAVNYFKTREAKANDAARAELAGLLSNDPTQQTSPEAKILFANDHADQPGFANHALLAAATQLHNEALTGDNTPDPTLTELSEETTKRLEAAAKQYRKIIDNPQAAEPSVYKLKARLGLASVYTTLGDTDNAAKQYQLVQDEAGGFTSFAATAKRKADQLEDLAQPLSFRPTPQRTLLGNEVIPDVADPLQPADTESPADGAADPTEAP